MTSVIEDREWISQALALGALVEGGTSPNPRVGCLVVREGVLVGRGMHRGAGQPHAETLALAEADEAARGSTLYVNLEPVKEPFLERHWGDSSGNLYEGTLSDFTPSMSGTLEAKTNEKLEVLRKDFHMKGFRKGKAPLTLMKQRFGKSVLGEVVQEAVEIT